MDDEHSPIYQTMQALEDQGLRVHVAYHNKRPWDPVGPEQINKLDGISRAAFEAGAEWVSVVIVSDQPVTPRVTKPDDAT